MPHTWIDEDDRHVSATGSKGIGEIRITGAAAAIANAVYHATGIRVRDLPITPGKFLGSAQRAWGTCVPHSARSAGAIYFALGAGAAGNVYSPSMWSDPLSGVPVLL